MQSTAPDALDLKLLQALQLDGRASFARMAEVLGVSDQTVARRFRRLHDTVRLRVLGMTDQAQLGLNSWLLRLRCTPDGAEQLAGALARRPDTSYITVISGGTEVMCAMQPRSRQAKESLLIDRLHRTPRVVSVSAHCLLHRYFGGPFGWLSKLNALSPEERAALGPPPPAPVDRPVVLDEDDEALLDVLARDGRAPVIELQAGTGLSESAVRRRLERLRSTGVLYLDVQFNHTNLGNEVVSMLWLTVAPRALPDVGRALAAHPDVRFAAAVTGRANVVAATVHSHTGDLYDFLSGAIGALDGVHEVETAMVQREVKQLTYEPDR
ncbi:Lrp/AsnC family transcriptional regulator [Kitasatospora phosalacinea]|uniref:Lrp/AsnC family transcriptional regulator n=1 Tax=Kitasatospora phosalacinea TaxID=2065 RepID=UPI0035DBA7FC